MISNCFLLIACLVVPLQIVISGNWVGSNRLDGEQRPALFVERVAAGAPLDGAESVGGEAGAPGGEGGDDEDGPDFECESKCQEKLRGCQGASCASAMSYCVSDCSKESWDVRKKFDCMRI